MRNHIIDVKDTDKVRNKDQFSLSARAFYAFQILSLQLYLYFCKPYEQQSMISLKIKSSIYWLIGLILLLLIGTMFYSVYSMSRLKDNLATQVHSTTVL